MPNWFPAYINSKHELLFWSKVEILSDEECWSWLGYLDREGYGLMNVKSGGEVSNYKAHRFAFWSWYGWWPEVCRHYVCDNPSCVNPHHLRDGTWQDNNRDTYAKGRRKEVRGSNGRFETFYTWKENPSG